MLGPFAGKRIVHVRILDPYALADVRARRAQAEFVKELLARSKAIEALTVEYAVSDTSREPEREQRVDLNRRLIAMTSGRTPRIALKARPGRRAGGTDFHDRTVFIDCAEGGRTLTHEFSVERGLIGLVDLNLQCTATYVPPES